MEALLRLFLCKGNTPNNQQNDKFLETCFFVNNLLAILCDTLIRTWGNRWLLRLLWSFSESVFRICVWMPIYVIMIYFTMNYNIQIFLSNNVKGIRTSQKRTRLFEYGKSYATSNGSVFLQKIYSTTSDGMKWVDEINICSHGKTYSCWDLNGYYGNKKLEIINKIKIVTTLAKFGW